MNSMINRPLSLRISSSLKTNRTKLWPETSPLANTAHSFAIEKFFYYTFLMRHTSATNIWPVAATNTELNSLLVYIENEMKGNKTKTDPIISHFLASLFCFDDEGR